MGFIRKALSIATVGLSDRIFEDDSKKGRTAKTKARRAPTQKQRNVTRAKSGARAKSPARAKPQARAKSPARAKQRAQPKPQAQPQPQPQPQTLRTPAAAPAVASADGTTSELERLADLHTRGALTDEEFVVAKARILGTSPAARESGRDAAAFPAVEANVAAARHLADLAAQDDASVRTFSGD